MSSAEALRDVVRFLNRQEFGGGGEDEPLNIVGNDLVANYAGLTLGSYFDPLFTADGKIIGYQASTITLSPTAEIKQFDVSKLAFSASEFHEVIYLDRLTRSLHALNYLANGLDSDLHLAVNPHHLQAVHANHGQVFAHILAQCGLQTDRFILGVDERAIADKQHLQNAINGWQRRRYRIALDFDGRVESLARVFSLKPDILKVGAEAVAQLSQSEISSRKLEGIIERANKLGIRTIATNIDTAVQHEVTQKYNFSARHGRWLTAQWLADAAEKVA